MVNNILKIPLEDLTPEELKERVSYIKYLEDSQSNEYDQDR